MSYGRTGLIVTDGDLAADAASFARHLRAANLTPTTQRAYLTGLDVLTLLQRAGHGQRHAHHQPDEGAR